ncbi:MAG TPA: zf-HC2 domain-containing protein, partial [Candidatus Baltobacteraceae bacterium]|nr:zf-HC2 domain-containing protein [Candidatus Baltobacteraceae bacterium]
MSGHLTNDSLIDFIHGELAPEDDAYVHGHLVACDACRQNYDAEVWLSDALRTAASAEEREFPSLVAAHVWEKVRTLQAGPLERIAAFLSPIARPALAVPL